MQTTPVLLCLLALLALGSIADAKRQTGASTTKSPTGKPSKTSYGKGARGYQGQGQTGGWNKGQKKEQTAEAASGEETEPTEPQTKKPKGAQKKIPVTAKTGKTYVLEKAAKPSLYTRVKPVKEMKVVEVPMEEAAVEVAEEEEEAEEPTTTLVLVKEAEAAESSETSEALLPSSVAAELAALRAELAAERELERLRATLDGRKQRAADKAARKAAWTAANPAALRPPKAKKCLDIDFTGPTTAEETGTAGGQPAPVLQRCSCSCRPALSPTNETTTTEPSLAQKVVGAVSDVIAQEEASLDNAHAHAHQTDNASLDQI